MAGIAAWLVPRVEFSLGGRRWPLVFTHRCLLECERLTGVDMLLTDMANPPIRVVRALIYCGVLAAGANSSQAEVGSAIQRIGLRATRVKLTKAWLASMPEAEKDAEPVAKDSKFAWIDAWAVARHDLRLSDDEWMDMTPRQLRALQKVRLDQLQREELLVGIITSHIVNFSMGAPKTPSKPADFMLHKLPEQPITGEYIMAQLSRVRERGAVI